jgi:hypothetical protein
MKQKGREIVGDIVKVDSYTSDWAQVRLHPGVFYRRYDDFAKGFKSVKGFYAELDLRQFIAIRFSDKNDVTNFHRLHHEYL